ncbi:MAG: PEP-CTERM sorting domain-containing protein [Planctomycetota bacterium]
MDWSGNLFRYDISAGYARTTVMTGLAAHDGLIYIPEPAALGLLALGVLALRRR